MPLRPRKEFFNKNLFSLVIVASLAIHALIILLSPWANQIFNFNPFQESFVREPGSYAVIFEIESTDDPKEKTTDVKPKEIEEKKYKIFTDTSDNREDEDVKVDTNKIGEKGSIAKDNFLSDKQSINNEPRAEGYTKTPLLGKAGTDLPVEVQQKHQGQETTAQVFVSDAGSNNKNTPPIYTNLPKGFKKQQESLESSQTPKVLSEEIKEKVEEIKTVKQSETIKKETTLQTPKRERLTFGRSIQQEEVEPLFNHEGVLFTDKQDEITNEFETKNESFPSPPREKSTKKEQEAVKVEKFAEKPIKTKETKESDMLKPDIPMFPSAMKETEAQREFQKGLDEQESPGELKNAPTSFSVNTKADGSRKEPILFEDTISNAAVRGAPSFNVKKHEYADYFKHIRDRISLYWFLGYGTRAEIKLTTKNDRPIIIEFKVLPNGSVGELKIVDDAGNFQLASRLIASIKNAVPLNPFPPKIMEPSIDVRFNFHFF